MDASQLFELIRRGDADGLQARLASDRSLVHAWTPDGHTPLHDACRIGRGEAVRQLLGAGADPDAVARNASRVHPLHVAAAVGSQDAMQQLLMAGADVDARQAGGLTALHARAAAGDEAGVRLLLFYGAKRQIRTDDGRTAADLAREKAHASLATLLDATT